MHPRRVLRRAALASIALLAVSVVPAMAADTTTTFEVTETGDLSVTVPTSATFTLARAGGEVAFPDVIRVTDGRDSLTRSWSVTVSGGTGFANTVDGVAIATSEVEYQPGALTFVSGVLSSSVTTTSNATLASGTVVVENTGVSTLGLLSDVVEWTPSLVVTPAAGLPTGTYGGTITHSVTGG